ncbi:2OG-Fe dioxygenase family protein [Mycobacterium noviomagense]|nr:2OG-Fe dioxygenase family protein [Mycobacterium noviomagense]
MPPSDLTSILGVDDDVWSRFSAYWEDLAPDRYAAELGLRRLRRYGRYRFTDGVATPMSNGAFVQPQDSNPLYIDRDRHFEPLTDAFMSDPLVSRLLRLLGRFATALDDAAEWVAKVHPFRVLASADGEGQPTPEGLHRDGVTLVTSLLVRRHNAVGGQSAVFDFAGQPLLAATLAEPGTLQLGDDRRTVHGVSPIRPVDVAEPALRDVLVITFAPEPPVSSPR